MIVTVSTVKDEVDNIRTFVDRNLARGVDHMVVFLDAGQSEVGRTLIDDASLTVVRDEDWWLPGERPAGLNRRQSVNASTVNAVLTTCPWATWLFHIDGDEVLDVDVRRLESLGRDVTSVDLDAREILNPTEAIAAPPGHTWFKRVPTEGELVLLSELGLVRRPAPQHLFRGHFGKCGLRPNLAYSVAVHRPFEGNEKVVGHREDGFRVLHLESSTFEEFERKWRNLVTAGPPGMIGMRPRRRKLATAIHTLLTSSASDMTKTRLLRQLYVSTATDDHAGTLAELGLLEPVLLDLPRPGHPSTDEAEIMQLRRGLGRARHLRKGVFKDGSPERRAEAVAALSS